MTSRAAPRAATWLLERACADPRHHPLIGDLAEQFAQGRSTSWYWRQALGAVAIRVVAALRIHGPSFVGAILVGCSLTWLLELCCTLTFEPFYLNLADIKRHPWSGEALWRLVGMMGNTLFWCALCCASAWAVTRVHRAHRRAVLMAFVMVQIAQRIPDLAQIVAERATNPQFSVSLATQVILAGSHAAFTLVSGLWMVNSLGWGRSPDRVRAITVLWFGQVLLTALLFSARRVGELSYAQPAGYLGMYVVGIIAGMYLAGLLWPLSSAPMKRSPPA